MEKRTANFLFMDVLLTIAAVCFIFAVFGLSQFAFAFELLVLLIFIFLLAYGMYNAYHGRRAGWILIAVILLAMILDVVFISAASASLSASGILTVLFSILALAVALINLKGEHASETPAAQTGPYYEKSQPETKENVKKKFEPGKYIASKKANKYHTAKCDWALRISKENQIWFNTKEDAELKGYVRDKCVE